MDHYTPLDSSSKYVHKPIGVDIATYMITGNLVSREVAKYVLKSELADYEYHCQRCEYILSKTRDIRRTVKSMAMEEAIPASKYYALDGDPMYTLRGWLQKAAKAEAYRYAMSMAVLKYVTFNQPY